MKAMNKIIVVFVYFFMVSCNNVFEFSPYTADVDDALKNQTQKNTGELVLEHTKSSSSYSFVTIADSHYKFKELQNAINKINTLEDVDFVVHLGDFTDKGLMMEYESFSKEIERLKLPIFTCIGNHDYLSNGGTIYKQMFGNYNYSIYYKNTKLVFFDATAWESGKQSDMTWFENELSSDDVPKIILSHIPPWDDQYTKENTMKYRTLVNNENVIVSLHGHHHDFSDKNPLETETPFLIPGSIDHGKLCKITVKSDQTFTYELIPF